MISRQDEDGTEIEIRGWLIQNTQCRVLKRCEIMLHRHIRAWLLNYTEQTAW